MIQLKRVSMHAINSSVAVNLFWRGTPDRRKSMTPLFLRDATSSWGGWRSKLNFESISRWICLNYSLSVFSLQWPIGICPISYMPQSNAAQLSLKYRTLSSCTYGSALLGVHRPRALVGSLEVARVLSPVHSNRIL